MYYTKTFWRAYFCLSLIMIICCSQQKWKKSVYWLREKDQRLILKRKEKKDVSFFKKDKKDYKFKH